MDGVSVRSLVEAVQERAGSDDPLVLLETAVLTSLEILRSEPRGLRTG